MADSEKVIKLKLEVAEAQANANIKKLQNSLEKLDGRTKEYTLTTRRLRLERQKLSDLRSQMTASNQQMTASMKESTSATGASTAASLELGRVFSDMPYGIRGVANNISQLASNVFFMSRKTDEVTGKVVGFGGALKGIGASLLGPAGVLVAFQLIVAIFEKLSMSSDKLKDTLSELQAESFTQNVLKLSLLRQAVNDSSISMEKKVETVKAAAGEFKELNKVIKDGSVNIGQFNKVVDAMIEEMKKVAYAKAILSESQDVMKSYVKEMIKGPAGALDSFDGFLSYLTDIANPAIVDGTTAIIKHTGKLGKLGEQYNKLYQILKDQDLFKLLFGGNKVTANKRIKEFNSRMLDFTREILAFNKRREEIEVETQEGLEEIERKYEKDSLKRKYDVFVEKEQLRLKQYKDSVKDEKNANELIEKAQKIHDDSMLEAQANYNIASADLDKAQKVEALERQRRMNEEIELLQLSYQRKINESRSFLSEETLLLQSERNIELLKEEIDHNERMLLEEKEGSMEYIKRQDDINRLQFDLRDADLEHEIMILEQKKNAQMEYVNYVQSLGGILSRVAGKNKDLALASLMLQKGAAIASVIIKNKQANSEIEQQASKDSAEAVTSGGIYMAKGAAMTALGNPAGVLLNAVGKKMVASAPTITAAAQSMKTKNNINAGISIASILATTFSSRGLGGSGSSGGGGIGVGGGGRTFDFNLAGSTGVNQLAGAVGGQFQQPIQAYVVSSQMTSQQQLDNIIQSECNSRR